MEKLALMVMLVCGTTVSLHAQAAPVADTWGHLKALPVHTRMHISADSKSRTCSLVSVDDQQLVCSASHDGSGKKQYLFGRSEIKSVKLTRYAVSTLAGAGIGGGVGAAVGFGMTQDPKGWFRGPVRGVLAAFGGIAGAAVCGPTDAFRGPTVYRRP